MRLTLVLLLRRLLSRLAYPPCAGPTFCRPLTQHTDTSVRDVCLLCGKKSGWHRVIGLLTHPPIS